MEKALKFPCFFNAFFKKLHRLAWKILKHNAFCISNYTGLHGKSMDISLLFQCFFQKTTSVWMEISMLFLLITTSVSMWKAWKSCLWGWRRLTLLAFETAFLWPFFHFNIPLLERLGAAFLSKKVEILIFCFLFFFSSSRPVITFNCQKSAFLVPTQGTSKLFSKKYYWIFRFRTPELSSKFLFFMNFESFLSCSAFQFRNVKVSKIEFLGSEYLN